jgi:hypothetical protein
MDTTATVDSQVELVVAFVTRCVLKRRKCRPTIRDAMAEYGAYRSVQTPHFSWTE